MSNELLDGRDVIQVSRDGAVLAGEGTVHAQVCPVQGAPYDLPHIVRHSPTGFEYGYGGSGPADLALSMLTVVLGPERADVLYMRFRSERIAPESGKSWSMKAETIREWAAHAEAALREIVADGERQ